MNAASFAPDFEESPPTERVPASGLARLIASTRPESHFEDDTLSRMPSLDLIAAAAGFDHNLISVMRDHYARDEMSEALEVARSVLVVNDADIEEIDSGFLDFDYST